MVRHKWLFVHKHGLTFSCSDAAVKQILLSLNEKQSFIIEDLDDFHVVIKADEEYRVRKQLENEVRHAGVFCIRLGQH